MFVPRTIRQKNNKQNKKLVPKKILHKETIQIKYLKTAGYLDTKDHDKIKQIMCLSLQKMRVKNYKQNKK